MITIGLWSWQKWGVRTPKTPTVAAPMFWTKYRHTAP